MSTLLTSPTAPKQSAGYDPRQWGARCDDCPLNGQRPVAPTGPLDAAHAVVGEGPGMHEVIQGQSFVGPSGQKLNDLLRRAGLDRRNTFVTNSIACRPEVPSEPAPRKYNMNVYIAWFRKQNIARKKAKAPILPSPFECCRPRLQKELALLEAAAIARGQPNGVVITPVGNYALMTLTDGKLKGVLKYRGSVLHDASILGGGRP